MSSHVFTFPHISSCPHMPSHIPMFSCPHVSSYILMSSYAVTYPHVLMSSCVLIYPHISSCPHMSLCVLICHHYVDQPPWSDIKLIVDGKEFHKKCFSCKRCSVQLEKVNILMFLKCLSFNEIFLLQKNAQFKRLGMNEIQLERIPAFHLPNTKVIWTYYNLS